MARRATPPTLGEVLRRRRLQLGMTQAQVATKVGCQPNFIGYLEANARRPSPRAMARLAKTLDLDERELYLLAHPHLRAVMAAPNEERGSAWERFKTNTRLHTRHGITRAELGALERVAALGSIRAQRDFLFILQTIRQALADE